MLKWRMSRRGQSITEYMVVVAAVIAALIAIIPSINTAAKAVMNKAATKMQGASAGP